MILKVIEVASRFKNINRYSRYSYSTTLSYIRDKMMIKRKHAQIVRLLPIVDMNKPEKAYPIKHEIFSKHKVVYSSSGNYLAY